MKRLAHLKPQDLASLPRDRTWILIPLGGLEDHGSHLPIGSDLLEAEGITTRLAERIEKEFTGHQVILFPSAPISIDREAGAGAVRVRPHVLRDYLIDCVDSLHRQGFRLFAVVSGNYGPKQLTVIEEASQLLAKKYKKFLFFGGKNSPRLLSLSSSDIETEKKSASLIWGDFSEHGGKRDTSVALALFPDQVSAHTELAPIELAASGWEKKRARTSGNISGYWGRPSEASREAGQILIDQKISQWLPLFTAAEKGVSALNLITSRYAKIPLNYSLFKVWLMAFFVIFFFMGWVYLSLMTLFTGANLQ